MTSTSDGSVGACGDTAPTDAPDEQELASIVLAIIGLALDGVQDPESAVRAARPYWQQLRAAKQARLLGGVS